MLYNYTILPLEEFLSILLSLLHGVTGSYLSALILLSIVVRIITTPLEKIAEKSVIKEHDINSVLSPQIAQIKMKFKGKERHDAIKRLYKRYGYHPVYAVRSMFSLLVQLPFFLAAYYMIGESPALKGVIIPFIGDLGRPDSILFGSINLLPFVMTGVNLAALYTTPGFDKKEYLQGFGIAILFLVLLYNSPSALLIYWTMNQAGSLVKNLTTKFIPKPIFSHQIITCIYIPFLFSITLFANLLFFKPFSIYLRNSSEFSYLYNEIVNALFANFFLVTILSTIFFATIYGLLKKYRIYLTALFVSLTLAIFIQGNILQWNYGLLDGKSIHWQRFWYREAIDFVVWGVTIWLSIKYRKFFQQKVTSIFYTLIIFQVLIFIVTQYKFLYTHTTTTAKNTKVNSVQYTADISKQFVFSKEKNIIILVFDGYRDSLFGKVLTEIPELKKQLDGFTRFTDMLGVGGYTQFSTATYLGTGTPFLNKQSHSQYLLKNFSGKDNTFLRKMVADKWTTGIYNKTVFSIFQKNPFTPSLLTEITTTSGKNKVQKKGDIAKILKVAVFSSSPQILKRFLFSALNIQNIWAEKVDYSSMEKTNISFDLPLIPDSAPDLQFFNAMQKGFKLREHGAAFKYFHIHGLHSPLPLIDKNFNKAAKTSQLEIGIVDAKLMLRLIHMLKSAKIYNCSQIYIIADHGQYPISSAVHKVQNYIKYIFPKDSQPLFLFKDFASSGELQVNTAQLTYLDLPQIIHNLSRKTAVKNYFKDKFERKTRLFYSFSNMNGENYPTIIEIQVSGDSHNPANWSLTGNTYSAVKNIKPLSNNSSIHFTKYKEYGGYVINGIIGGGTKTRGDVDFALPLDKTLDGTDIRITIELAARADEQVNYRDYAINIKNSTILKGQLKAPDYTPIYVDIPVELINSNIIKFTLKALNPSHGYDKETGKRMWSEAFKIKKLTVQKIILTADQKTKIIRSAHSGNLRLSQLTNLKNALEKYFSKYGHYPHSVGYDGIQTKWGKASENWIDGLVPEFIEKLPIDPQMSDGENVQYLYKSDGQDYKLLAHGVAPSTKKELQMQDPKRPTWAFGYWTDGAKNW